jgi:hypothetical protein
MLRAGAALLREAVTSIAEGLDRRQRAEQMDIREDDLSSDATQALLRMHLAGMHTNSPPGHVFALDLSGLKARDVTVWSAWEGNEICGIGALRQLDASCGEVKSMRTTQTTSGGASPPPYWSASSKRLAHAA